MNRETKIKVLPIEMAKLNTIRNTFCKKTQLTEKGISAHNQKQIIDKGYWTEFERDTVLKFWDELVEVGLLDKLINPEGDE